VIIEIRYASEYTTWKAHHRNKNQPKGSPVTHVKHRRERGFASVCRNRTQQNKNFVALGVELCYNIPKASRNLCLEVNYEAIF
jgi:hypothetical protein